MSQGLGWFFNNLAPHAFVATPHHQPMCGFCVKLLSLTKSHIGSECLLCARAGRAPSASKSTISVLQAAFDRLWEDQVQT
jgi:hypothetical protein